MQTIWRGKVGTPKTHSCNVILSTRSVPVTSMYCTHIFIFFGDEVANRVEWTSIAGEICYSITNLLTTIPPDRERSLKLLLKENAKRMLPTNLPVYHCIVVVELNEAIADYMEKG